MARNSENNSNSLRIFPRKARPRARAAWTNEPDEWTGCESFVEEVQGRTLRYRATCFCIVLCVLSQTHNATHGHSKFFLRSPRFFTSKTMSMTHYILGFLGFVNYSIIDFFLGREEESIYWDLMVFMEGLFEK